jgi:hypothetical protein
MHIYGVFIVTREGSQQVHYLTDDDNSADAEAHRSSLNPLTLRSVVVRWKLNEPNSRETVLLYRNGEVRHDRLTRPVVRLTRPTVGR